MQYKSLHNLISVSSSSRKFFLSQAVPIQTELHRHNEYIHSAADLHAYTDIIKKSLHAIEISEMLFKK